MKVESTVRPKPLEITEKMVFINTNIREEQRNMGMENEETMTMYVYNQEAYTTGEYIEKMQGNLTDTELALCEIYEEVIS